MLCPNIPSKQNYIQTHKYHQYTNQQSHDNQYTIIHDSKRKYEIGAIQTITLLLPLAYLHFYRMFTAINVVIPFIVSRRVSCRTKSRVNEAIPLDACLLRPCLYCLAGSIVQSNHWNNHKRSAIAI